MKSSGQPKVVTSPGTQPADAISVAGWRELGLWLFRLRRRYQVSGRSMIPLLEPGDEVLVNPRAAIREADIVVARHPYRQDSIWIKYVAAFDDAGRAQLVGLNAHESTDSRTQGNVPMELILGKVTSRFGSKNSMT